MIVRPGKLLLAVMVLAAGQFTLAATCHAQAVGFSVASGGGGGHHHHGHHHYHPHSAWSFSYGVGPYWGPGWGPGWYGPPAIVYAPPPVVQPVYIQPQTIAPVSPGYSSNTPAPPTSGTLAANTVPSVAGSTANDDRIVIRNAAGASLPVSFLVDGQDVELTDGATRTFVGKTHRTIQFDRGGRFGSTQQDLTGGQYEFRVTASGWDLVRKPDFVPSTGRTAVRTNSLPDLNVAR